MAGDIHDLARFLRDGSPIESASPSELLCDADNISAVSFRASLRTAASIWECLDILAGHCPEFSVAPECTSSTGGVTNPSVPIIFSMATKRLLIPEVLQEIIRYLFFPNSDGTNREMNLLVDHPRKFRSTQTDTYADFCRDSDGESILFGATRKRTREDAFGEDMADRCRGGVGAKSIFPGSAKNSVSESSSARNTSTHLELTLIARKYAHAFRMLVEKVRQDGFQGYPKDRCAILVSTFSFFLEAASRSQYQVLRDLGYTTRTMQMSTGTGAENSETNDLHHTVNMILVDTAVNRAHEFVIQQKKEYLWKDLKKLSELADLALRRVSAVHYHQVSSVFAQKRKVATSVKLLEIFDILSRGKVWKQSDDIFLRLRVLMSMDAIAKELAIVEQALLKDSSDATEIGSGNAVQSRSAEENGGSISQISDSSSTSSDAGEKYQTVLQRVFRELVESTFPGSASVDSDVSFVGSNSSKSTTAPQQDSTDGTTRTASGEGDAAERRGATSACVLDILSDADSFDILLSLSDFAHRHLHPTPLRISLLSKAFEGFSVRQKKTDAAGRDLFSVVRFIRPLEKLVSILSSLRLDRNVSQDPCIRRSAWKPLVRTVVGHIAEALLEKVPHENSSGRREEGSNEVQKRIFGSNLRDIQLAFQLVIYFGTHDGILEKAFLCMIRRFPSIIRTYGGDARTLCDLSECLFQLGCVSAEWFEYYWGPVLGIAEARDDVGCNPFFLNMMTHMIALCFSLGAKLLPRRGDVGSSQFEEGNQSITRSRT